MGFFDSWKEDVPVLLPRASPAPLADTGRLASRVEGLGFRVTPSALHAMLARGARAAQRASAAVATAAGSSWRWRPAAKAFTATLVTVPIAVEAGSQVAVSPLTSSTLDPCTLNPGQPQAPTTAPDPYALHPELYTLTPDPFNP
jgi:hypothetical protein